MASEEARLLIRIEATQKKFERQLASMNRATKKTTTKMERNFLRSNKRSEASFKKLGNTANNVLSGGFLRGAGVVSTIALIGVAALEAAKRGEKLLIIERRLEAITDSGARAEASLDAILQVARLTGTSIDTVASAFSRYTLAAQEIGATTGEVETLTQTILQLGVIGGGTQQELSAGAQQLGQSLAKGVLNGDELRSVMENMPLVAKAIADGLGVSVGKLKEMGAAGELTSRKVFDALLSGADEANAKFETMPLTIERASTRMTNALSITLAKINEITGASRIFAGVFDGIAFGLERFNATGDQKIIQDRQASILEKVNRKKAIGTGAVEQTSRLFSSKKRLNFLAQQDAQKIAEINKEIKADLDVIRDIEKRITDQKDQQQDYEKAKGITTGKEKADKAEIAALQKIEDKRAFNALDKRTQAGQKARDEAMAALKAESGFATKAQLQNVGRRAEQEALATFDSKANRKSGGRAARKATKELLDFFDSMDAQEQALRDEIELIGLSEKAIVRLGIKQELLARAKKKGLDLDQRSIETGRTLREDIEAQADVMADLTDEYERGVIAQDRYLDAVDGVSDALANTLVAGDSLRDGLRSVFQGIAQDIVSSGIREALGSVLNGGSSGGGLFGNILGSVLGGGTSSGTGSLGLPDPFGKSSAISDAGANSIIRSASPGVAPAAASGPRVVSVPVPYVAEVTTDDKGQLAARLTRMEGDQANMKSEFDGNVINAVQDAQDARILG